MKPKDIKVAHIIDENTIIINYGIKDMVLSEKNKITIGDTLEVYQGGFEVIDPDTKEKLGVYEDIKAIIEIIDMKERFSVCKKKYTYSSKSEVYLSPLHKRLHLNSQNNTINIGDKVRKNF